MLNDAQCMKDTTSSPLEVAKELDVLACQICLIRGAMLGFNLFCCGGRDFKSFFFNRLGQDGSKDKESNVDAAR